MVRAILSFRQLELKKIPSPSSLPGKVVTVERINSNMNGSSHGARNSEATVIGPIVVQAIADKPEFNGILVIRVQYLRRSSQSSKVVDTIEYRKDASGKFQFHET